MSILETAATLLCTNNKYHFCVNSSFEGTFEEDHKMPNILNILNFQLHLSHSAKTPKIQKSSILMQLFSGKNCITPTSVGLKIILSDP